MLKQIDAEFSIIIAKSFRRCGAETRLYLKTPHDHTTLKPHPTGVLSYLNELSIFKKLKYFPLYGQSEEISLKDSMTELNELYHLTLENRFCFYRLALNRILIKDNEVKQLMLLDNKFRLIKTLRFAVECFCWQLKLIKSRVVFTLFDISSKSSFIYVADDGLNLMHSRKLSSSRSPFVEFSADTIYFKSWKSNAYIVMDLQLKVIDRVDTPLLTGSGVVLHSLTGERAVVQSNLTREIQITSRGGTDEDKENQVRVVRVIKLEKATLCRKVFVDAEANVYILSNTVEVEPELPPRIDSGVLSCYDMNGRFEFQRCIDLFARFKIFEAQGEDLYFSDQFHTKTVF
jgi:hypothetical protein